MALTASQQKQLADAKTQLQAMQKTLDARKAAESTKKVSYGTSSSGAKLSSTGSKLDTSGGQSLKDYSIAFGGGGSKITSDSNDAKNNENSVKADLEYNSDALDKLKRDQERQIAAERAALELRRANEVDAIGTRFDEQKTGLEFQQNRETGQTSTDLARAGGYLGNTASQAGVMQNLRLVQREEMQSLQSSRETALREANNAYEDRDFELAREKLQVGRDIEQEIYNRTEEFNAKIKELTAVENDNQMKAEEQRQIYNAITVTGKDSIEDIFNELGGKVTVESIRSYLNNVSGASTSTDAFKFSASNTAGLLGAGMGQDDIKALNEYINQNGYDEAIRGSLTTAERAAADKIFRDIEKVTGGGVGSGTNPGGQMSLLELGRIQTQYGVTFPLGVSYGEVSQFLNDNIGADPGDMQDAINLIFGKSDSTDAAIGGNYKIEVNPTWLKANLTAKQLKKLADLTGVSSFWKYKTFDVANFLASEEAMSVLQGRVDAARAQGYTDADILELLTA